jgi:hypothetical protein
LFILLSVGLAFGVGQCREARENHELAARALRSLQDEVEFNATAVEPYLAFHREWVAALNRAVGDPAGKTGLAVYGMTRPATPMPNHAEFPVEVRRGAWDAALSTGALRLIDYDVVAALSHTYQLQAFYGDTINRVVTAVTATPAFDPASRSLVAQQLGVDFGTVIFAEETLLQAYQQNLQTLQTVTSGR